MSTLGPMKMSIKAFKVLPVLCLTLTSVAWGQSNVTIGELNFPRFGNLSRYINVDFFYTNDFISNTGGVKAGPRNIGAADLYLETDFRKYSRVSGEMMIHFTHINKNDQRGGIGDTQVASNIDMPDQTDRMTDLYYQHHWSDKLATLLGIHDISMEFNVTESSLNFLNGGFGTDTAFAVSGANGPSIYPITTVGFRTKYQLNDEITFLGGLYDADPGTSDTWRRSKYDVGQKEGYLIISELSHASDSHKAGIGGWNYTKAKSKHNEEVGAASAFGSYGMYEHNIRPGLWAFARYGWANPLVNIVQSNAVTGIVYRGLLQRKKTEDEVGLGYSRAHFSRSFVQENEGDSSVETAYEFYYHFKPTKNISLRPDIQFIANPTGNSKKDAWATGFRTVVEI